MPRQGCKDFLPNIAPFRINDYKIDRDYDRAHDDDHDPVSSHVSGQSISRPLVFPLASDPAS